MTVSPTFLTAIRNVTWLPTGTGVFVGLNSTFVILSAAWVTPTVALEELVAAPPLAVAELLAVPVLRVVNVTVKFVLWPGVIAPKFVHVKTPGATVLGGRLATALVNLLIR